MDDLLKEFALELREGHAQLVPLLENWCNHPLDAKIYDAIFRHLHSAKAGAGFVRMGRIEALAAAAEQGLADMRHWGLSSNDRHARLIVAALNRINAIADALDIGVGYPTNGEECLIRELLGQPPQELQVDAMPFDPTQLRSVRLSRSTIDDLTVKSGSLAIALVDLGDTPAPAALAIVRRDVVDLAEMIRALRFAPAAQLYVGLAQHVDELAARQGVQAQLIIDSGETLLDRAHLPVLRTALCHLLRNAIAHGIEPDDERIRCGKPRKGVITLSTTHAGDEIIIEIADDGRGVDYDALVKCAGSSACSPPQSAALLCAPHVSTAREMSNLAGHGMGLQSVQIALERLEGTLELFDRQGQGFTARLVVPQQSAVDCA